MSLSEEHKIFSKARFNVPDVAYVLSRSVILSSKSHQSLTERFSVGTLGYSVSATVFQGIRYNFLAKLFITDMIICMCSWPCPLLPRPFIYHHRLPYASNVVHFIVVSLPCSGRL